MAIVLAGPLFNFLFAILVYWAVLAAGVEGLRPLVGHVLQDSIAERAGFRAGDEILSIDERAVASWDQRRLYLFRRALDRATVRVEVRDPEGQRHERLLDLSTVPMESVNAGLVERGIGLIGVLPQALPVLEEVAPGPAQRAGMLAGDRIVRIDGAAITRWEEIVERVSAAAGRELEIVVERDGARHALRVTPEAVEQGGRKVGRIQIRPRVAPLAPEMRVTVRLGTLEALAAGVENTWSMSVLTLEMLYHMLRLEVSAKNISGPLTIAQYAGHSAKIGAVQFLAFLAVISISLGVLNLLPIPVLDGGHLLYYAIEAVRGRPLPERVLIWGQQLGLAILAGLMLLAFYNDIMRLLR